MRVPTRAISFAIAGAFILAVFWPLMRPPDTTLHRAVLQRQFKSLKAPAEARLIYRDERPKLGRVFLGAYYTSGMSFDQVRNFYLPQLQRNGWELMRTAGVTEEPRRLTLCKGDYQANLEDAGERQNIGWTYALSMSWGSERQCAAAR